MLNDSITHLIQAPDTVVNHFLQRLYPSVANDIMPVLTLSAILYWVIWGYQIYAGNTAFVAVSLLKKAGVTTTAFFLLQWQSAAWQIYQSVRNVMEHIVSLAVSHGQTGTIVLESLSRDVGQIAAFLMEDSAIGMVLQGYGLMLLNCAFVIVVVVELIFAKVGLALCIVLLPFFVIFLFFPFTQPWVNNWVNSWLRCVLLFLFVHLLLHMASLSFSTALEQIHDANQVLSMTDINVTTTAYIYVIEGLFLGLLILANIWSASMSHSAGVLIKQISHHHFR